MSRTRGLGAIAIVIPVPGESCAPELEKPTSVAVDDDAVWVLDAFARTVTRVRR